MILAAVAERDLDRGNTYSPGFEIDSGQGATWIWRQGC